MIKTQIFDEKQYFKQRICKQSNIFYSELTSLTRDCNML